MVQGTNLMGAQALAGKVALVTGGTRGIGFAIAEAYLAAGARVVISGRDAASLDAAAGRLRHSNRCRGVAGDLTTSEAPTRVVATAASQFGRLDILVNNAGISGSADIWKTDAADWDRVQAVNLRAAFFCAREFAARVKAAGGGGAIINLSSVAGQIGGVATGPAYVASKAGVIGLTRSLARHFAPLGVRVNCIAPADIDTDMTAAWPDELRKRLAAMTPLGRFGSVEEVSNVAVFLASDAASFITGQTLNVNGGIYMG